MPTHYVTVYQISADPGISSFANLLHIATPILVFVALGFSAMAYVFWKRRNEWRRHRWFVVIPCLVFTCLLAVSGFVLLKFNDLVTHGEDIDADAVNAFRKGDYQTVEGTVTNFDPMPYEGHKLECFSVQGQRFCYSDYFVAPGFRNAASHGGPIRPDLAVQIDYRNSAGHNTILRLKIAR